MEPKVAEDEAEIGTDRDKRAQRKAAVDMEKVAIAADEKRLRLLKEDEAERRELAREEAEVALHRARVKLEMGGLQQQEQSAREQSEREIAASVAALEAMQREEIMANLETHLEDIRWVHSRAEPTESVLLLNESVSEIDAERATGCIIRRPPGRRPVQSTGGSAEGGFFWTPGFGDDCSIPEPAFR